jgi:hypothetical protein
MSDAPKIPYWYLWTDADGISHQTQCVMDRFVFKSIPPADPQWQGEMTRGTMTMMLMVLPIGWIGTWHENPKPQWIVPLSGRWFVEAMDGSKTEMGPGEFSFGGDQNSRDVDGKCGHRSGTVGDAPAVLMVVQLASASAPPSPGEMG